MQAKSGVLFQSVLCCTAQWKQGYSHGMWKCKKVETGLMTLQLFTKKSSSYVLKLRALEVLLWTWARLARGLCMRIDAWSVEWGPVRLHTSRVQIVVLHSQKCNQQKWPPCVKNIPRFKAIKLKKNNTTRITHTRITHWAYTCMWQCEKESGAVSTRESRRGDEKAVQPHLLLLWKTFLVCFSIYS